jgi:putative intracellular protease/amidase
MAKTIVTLLLDGFADWEIGPVLPGAREYLGADVVIAGLDGSRLRSIGGLSVLPERRLADLDPAAAEMWILAGSDGWAKGPLGGLSKFLKARAAAGRQIAAICGATLALGHAGLLNLRAHTSNSREFLVQHVPGYRGKSRYREAFCVSDGGIITAPGSAPVSFAVEVLRALAPEKEKTIEAFRSHVAAEFAGPRSDRESAAA